MNITDIERIFQDHAHIRTAGSEEERRCAEFFLSRCAELGSAAKIETFPLKLSRMQHATLLADGRSFPCEGYRLCGSGEVEGKLHYLTATDPASLRQCKGKIVLFDGLLRGWVYRDLLAAGALGFLTYDGDVRCPDRDIDKKFLHDFLQTDDRLLGVHLHAKDAVELVRSAPASVKLSVQQEELDAQSQNVIWEIPGETEEWIVLTAHYDSTPLSCGAYDNLSGSTALLALAEHFAHAKLQRGLRLIWCGSEERGLLGSRNYCSQHEDELDSIVLNVNLDMIGCLMGRFVARCTAEERFVHYVQYFAAELGVGIESVQSISSSDCSSFADKGIPAISFFRFAPQNTATIHNRYDTPEVMSAAQLLRDIDFVARFVERMANAIHFPVAREIPENMQKKLDHYFYRKRDPAAN